MASVLRVGIGQIAPVFLNRRATLAKVCAFVREAAKEECGLIAFGETAVPGYPTWLARTGGARFNDAVQKALYRRYLEEAVCVEDGDLAPVQRAARESQIDVVLGVLERGRDRGSHTGFASAVYIRGSDGAVVNVHRKLVPTYEERLVWGAGDGAGLQTRRVGAGAFPDLPAKYAFTAGVLNCWENWMPLARAALYAQGEDLRVALWPGSRGLTKDVTRFVALEGRSFVVSASAVLRAEDLDAADVPFRDEIVRGEEEVLYDGGSCVAAPDGSWVVDPASTADGQERLLVVELDHRRVREERQNFDPAGHYSRPDVLHLTLDRQRQAGVAVRGSFTPPREWTLASRETEEDADAQVDDAQAASGKAKASGTARTSAKEKTSVEEKTTKTTGKEEWEE